MQCLFCFPVRRARRAVAAALLALPCSVQAQAPAARAAGDTVRLSLDQAVTLGLRQSDEIGLARAQIDVADAQYANARASILPQLRFNGAYTHVYESARGQAVGAVFNQPNTYTASTNLSQTLFQGGRLVSTARAANETRQAAREDEREERASVTVQVQRAYLQALFTARIAELQEGNLVLATNRMTQIEQLQRAGQAARYDVLRARVERSNLEPLAIQARNDRELALLDLKRLLNVPIDKPIVLTSQIDQAATAAILATAEDTTSVADRPAIRSAELNVAARRLGVAVARADYYPALSVFFQQGYQAFPPIGMGFPTTRGSLTEGACPPGTVAGRVCQNGGFFSDRQLGLNVSFPIFDGFRVKSNVDLANAQARVAELQLQVQRETVALDVARARAELRRSRASFAARQQNSGEAREAFQLASLRFSRGLSTQLEVSDAQLALLTAESTEARATYDLFLASADLARALGRPILLPSATTTSPTPR
ncbi:MAG: outer rane efflux protein [Gemmatimonadetes bacterium]|nr:outer rane efflux protein [Gemmatimonadota bacterium]